MGAITQTQNSGFLEGNLHFKPISARLARGVFWTATSIQKCAQEDRWHGFFVVMISKVAFFTGAILCIPIALIETAAGLALGAVGILLNQVFCNNRSEFLQKHSLKALSFASHSCALSILLFLFETIKIPELRFHIAYVVADHTLHLGSAALVQGVLGASWTDPDSAMTRVFNLLKDSHPDLLEDFLAQLNNSSLGERIRQTSQNYLTRHPEEQFVRTLNVRELIQNDTYRLRALGALQTFLTEEGFVRAVRGNARHLELILNNEEELAYQDHLAGLVRDSFVAIHNTPNLWQHLNRDETQGNTLFERLDAAIHIPLARYTQYQEILQNIRCPNTFARGDFTQYNERQAKLLEAKGIVEALSPDQRDALVQKILRGEDVNAEGGVQEAFIKISALAFALQGPLMKNPTINLLGEEAEEFFRDHDLFQTACLEARDQIAPQEGQRPRAVE